MKVDMLKYAVQMDYIKIVSDLKSIFMKSVEAVNPENLIRNTVKVHGSGLVINGVLHQQSKPCYVVGFGKAVLGMSIALKSVLGKRIEKGIVNIPTGIYQYVSNRSCKSQICYIEGAANNLPDENAWIGAKQIKDLVVKLEKDDLLVVLISGGGSALLPLPKHPVTLSEKLDVIKGLAASGASIQELNCVRKCLSELKGGGLASLAYPANVISLILSDIVGDPLDYIASGPTTPNSDSNNDAINVIKKYSLYDKLPYSIKSLLQSETRSTSFEPAISKGSFVHVHNYIIGNNSIATQAAYKQATALGYQSYVLSTKVTGEVDRISKIYAELACNVASLINCPRHTAEKLKVFLECLHGSFDITEAAINELINLDINLSTKGICLILGGEPTVVVKGNGKGGRNQQLALAFSVEVAKLGIELADISFLSCGTDGIDGPTDAAGAIGTLNLVNQALRSNINPEEYLLRNDSYNFYCKFMDSSHLIRTGHTGTNVMDIHLILISPKALHELKHNCISKI